MFKQGNELNDATGATFTLDNGQTYQIPQFQIYTPIYQRAPNANLNISQTNGSSDELVCALFDISFHFTYNKFKILFFFKNQQQADLNKVGLSFIYVKKKQLCE